MTRRYSFDVELSAAFTVEAGSAKAGRELLDRYLECATVRLLDPPDRRVVLEGEASADGEHDLIKINGVPADSDREYGELMGTGGQLEAGSSSSASGWPG